MTSQPPPMTPGDPDERARALDARLAAIEARLGRHQGAAKARATADYRAGNRVLADLIGGITGGLFLGWVIDQFAGTQPWGLLVMMVLGIVVAFRNILRHSSTPGMAPQSAETVPDDADDDHDPQGSAGAGMNGTEGRD